MSKFIVGLALLIVFLCFEYGIIVLLIDLAIYFNCPQIAFAVMVLSAITHVIWCIIPAFIKIILGIMALGLAWPVGHRYFSSKRKDSAIFKNRTKVLIGRGSILPVVALAVFYDYPLPTWDDIMFCILVITSVLFYNEGGAPAPDLLRLALFLQGDYKHMVRCGRSLVAFWVVGDLYCRFIDTTIFPPRVLDLDGDGGYLVHFQTLENSFESWLSFAFFLYALGLFGRIINRKNFIVTRRAVERRYLGVITSFVLYGVATNDPRGTIYGLLLVILAACESAIGLGIIIVLHRFGGTISFQDYEELGG